MRRSQLGLLVKERQAIIYHPTPVERACNILSQGDDIHNDDLYSLCRQLSTEDGWKVDFIDKPNEHTASFSTKEGKIITVYTVKSDQLPRSIKHLIASIMHEYLYGELVSEAKLTPDPKQYILKNYKEFSEYDALVARQAGVSGKVPISVAGVILHRMSLQEVEISYEEIDRLLIK